MKGLAEAPPAIVASIGVSTSKNPLLSKNSLIPFIIWLLFIKVDLTSGFVIISTSLCLYLKSGSFNPCHFSGSGFNDLHINSISLALIDISPVLVLKTSPVQATQSPKSLDLYCFNASSPTSSIFINNWILPSLS